MTAAPLPIVERLRRLPPAVRAHVYAEIERRGGPGALSDVRYDFEGFWGRASQIITPEEIERSGLVILTGPRGDGKTQGVVHAFCREIYAGRALRPRIFAATEDDIVQVVVKGPSGVMATLPPELRPTYIKSDGQAGVLRFRNGVEAVCFSVSKTPEAAVGHQGDLDLYDDVAKWGPHAFTGWAHARASCRLGVACGLVATTRRGTTLLRKLLKGDVQGVLVKRGSDLIANRFNLSPKVYRQTAAELGGSDFLRQEMGDEEIGTSPLSEIDFDAVRISTADPGEFAEVAVAIDPADGQGSENDDWGVGAAARRADRHVVVLEDATGDYSDEEAAGHALRLCAAWGARTIVAESNRGKRVISAVRAAYYKLELDALKAGVEAPISMPEIVMVTAVDSKVLRAGPVATLYKTGFMHHLPGLGKLEAQMREWDPKGPKRAKQDDRIDWVVHVAHHLADLSGTEGPAAAERMDGIAERVRRIQDAGAARAEGADALVRSDTVPASDPRSSYRARAGGGGARSLGQRRIL